MTASDHSSRLRNWLAHAFAVGGDASFTPEERELAERLARFLVQRRMTAPAMMALEVGRPVTFLGSQLLVFLQPFLTLVFSPDETDRFRRLMERRRGVDVLLDALTRLESEHSRATRSTDDEQRERDA